MIDVSLDVYQSAGLSVVALIVGLVLVRHSKTLRRFCLPAAVMGGLVFAAIALILYSTNLVEFHFDDTLKSISMNIFFCSVGFLASYRMLRSGGKIVVVLIGLMIVLVILQNIIGVAMATAFNLDPLLGLAMGSIGLVGGHGTAAAYGEILVDEYGLVCADAV